MTGADVASEIVASHALALIARELGLDTMAAPLHVAMAVHRRQDLLIRIVAEVESERGDAGWGACAEDGRRIDALLREFYARGIGRGLADRVRDLADRHHDLAARYEAGGNADGARYLRYVSNMLFDLLYGDGNTTTILPEDA